MGIRMDQHMGLPENAINYLAKFEICPPPCPTCGRQFGAATTKIGCYDGMFQDEYPLSRHQLKNGWYADEYLQASPWSSGPVFFIGLRVYDELGHLQQDFCWTDDEIEENQ